MRKTHPISTMHETIQAGGKSIRLEAHPAPNGPAPALVLLHGSGGNVDWWAGRMAALTSAAGLSLFAPHYFDRTDTRRAELPMFTDGLHVPLWLDTISATVNAVRARPEVDPDRIALVGVSLGGFLALALAAGLSASKDSSERAKIRCIVELSGGLIEPFASAATTHFPPTLILHGTRDEVVPVTQAITLDKRLTQLAVPHEIHLLEGEGHWFSNAAQPQLLMRLAAFLNQQLR
jgi:dipeptidyl aminopeptidase/acylaminoacyl peptidase